MLLLLILILSNWEMSFIIKMDIQLYSISFSIGVHFVCIFFILNVYLGDISLKHYCLRYK